MSERDLDDENFKAMLNALIGRHGPVLSPRKHDAPELLGQGWLVSFELPKSKAEKMPVVRAAFFRDENSRPVLAREFIVRDGEGNYPAWRSIAETISEDRHSSSPERSADHIVQGPK